MRKSVLYIIVVCVMVIGILGSTGCRKTATLTKGGVLRFSTDTLAFDTVFTTQGSYTNSFVIYNPQSEAVVISSIRMQNGAASYFHINVDGFTGNTVQNLKIAAHDSAYVFATVNINPNDSLTPYLISDALVATMNGQTFTMPFTAYGQNAHYIVNDSLGAGNYPWQTDKPYVVIGNLIVGQNATLNIPKGCRVYMHQTAQIIVWPGATLNVGQTGKTGDSVVFQGDRLDRAYFGYVGYPGEWCGIWFLNSSQGFPASGYISNTILKNCGNGAAYLNAFVQPAALRVDTGSYVRIDHSTIKNSISLGILGFQGNVTATDCNVNTTGGQALAVVWGGNDSFVNCTFANYGTAQVSHASAGTVAINNWFTPDNQHYYYGNLNVVLENCIVYGSLDSEISCDTTGSYLYGTFNTSLQITNCLLKMGQVREPFVHFTGTNIFNQDPMFKNTASGDFHLSAGSPALGAGVLNGQAPLNEPFWQGMGIGTGTDIGCY